MRKIYSLSHGVWPILMHINRKCRVKMAVACVDCNRATYDANQFIWRVAQSLTVNAKFKNILTRADYVLLFICSQAHEAHLDTFLLKSIQKWTNVRLVLNCVRCQFKGRLKWAHRAGLQMNNMCLLSFTLLK